MTLNHIVNLIGLLCVTAGSIGAAFGSPSPTYGADGSVTLSGEPDKAKRITKHRWQKKFRYFLFLIAFGAALQALTIFLPT